MISFAGVFENCYQIFKFKFLITMVVFVDLFKCEDSIKRVRSELLENVCTVRLDYHAGAVSILQYSLKLLHLKYVLHIIHTHTHTVDTRTLLLLLCVQGCDSSCAKVIIGSYFPLKH